MACDGSPREWVRLEDGLKLDLNRLIRQNLIRPGAAWGSTINWRYSYSGEEFASGRVAADMMQDRHGWLRLELGSLDQRIGLEAATRHFGGLHVISCVRTPAAGRQCFGSPPARDPSPVASRATPCRMTASRSFGL